MEKTENKLVTFKLSNETYNRLKELSANSTFMFNMTAVIRHLINNVSINLLNDEK